MNPFRILLVCLPFILFCGSCVQDDPVTPVDPTPPAPVPQPKPETRVLHVTSTSFSLGDGITNPRDSLFINFDGKIISSTIPHYDWIYGIDYYYPENRVILHDTTLVLVFDGHQADRFGQENEYGFTVTGEDGGESPVSVKIPFFDHVIHFPGTVHQMSLYNEEKELLFFSDKTLIRMDFVTGDIIREYDLSELPGRSLFYTENRHNGLLYLRCGFRVYALDPETGDIRIALVVPEDPDEVYQIRLVSSLAFTKYGSGVVVLSCEETDGTRMKIVRVSPDGSLALEDMDEYQDDESYQVYFPLLYQADWLVESRDGTFIHCVTRLGSAYYFKFNGATCHLELGHCGRDQKCFVTPNKKTDAWLMRELYSQYLLYPDGTTSPEWHLDSRHEGGADFCYTPGYEHLVVTFEREEFINAPARVQMIDTASGELVFSKLILQDQQEFQTTSDGKYAIAYRDDYGYGKDTRIFVYDMPTLLSRCRFGGK